MCVYTHTHTHTHIHTYIRVTIAFCHISRGILPHAQGSLPQKQGWFDRRTCTNFRSTQTGLFCHTQGSFATQTGLGTVTHTSEGTHPAAEVRRKTCVSTAKSGRCKKNKKTKNKKSAKQIQNFLKKNSETSSETSIVHGRESGRYIQMDFQKNKVRIFECQQQVLAVQKKKIRATSSESLRVHGEVWMLQNVRKKIRKLSRILDCERQSPGAHILKKPKILKSQRPSTCSVQSHQRHSVQSQ